MTIHPIAPFATLRISPLMAGSGQSLAACACLLSGVELDAANVQPGEPLVTRSGHRWAPHQ